LLHRERCSPSSLAGRSCTDASLARSPAELAPRRCAREAACREQSVEQSTRCHRRTAPWLLWKITRGGTAPRSQGVCSGFRNTSLMSLTIPAGPRDQHASIFEELFLTAGCQAAPAALVSLLSGWAGQTVVVRLSFASVKPQLFAMLPHTLGGRCLLHTFQLTLWQGRSPSWFRTETASPLDAEVQAAPWLRRVWGARRL